MTIRGLPLLALACALLVPAANATADVAPGQITFPLAVSPESAVPTPDAGAELFVSGVGGYSLVRVTAGGALDPSFGVGGVAPVAWPAGIVPGPMLREPDGHLVVLGGTVTTAGLPTVDAVGLNADGSLNQAFGDQGVTRLDLQVGRVGSSLAGVQTNGDVVFTASSGPPPNVLHQSWVVARLTTAGVLDPTFGIGGVATVAGENSNDDALVLGADDSILTLGEQRLSPNDPTRILLDRLTPNGAQDPSWNGGAPLLLALNELTELAERADGSSVVTGTNAANMTGTSELVNVSASGTVGPAAPVQSPSSGAPATLIDAPDGSVLFNTGVRSVSYARDGSVLSSIDDRNVSRFNLDGTITPVAAVPQFAGNIEDHGGDLAYLVAPGRVAPLAQGTIPEALLPLAGGGYLGYTVAGLNHIDAKTRQQSGFSELALEWLTPALALDPAVGGPATPLSVAVAVHTTLRSFARHNRHVSVSVTLSAPSVARVVVRAGRTVLAQNIVEYLSAGRHPMTVPLTASGSHLLATHRHIAIVATLDAQNVIATVGHATTAGRLR
jgi:uncharacterized delta-60 repeat protein